MTDLYPVAGAAIALAAPTAGRQPQPGAEMTVSRDFQVDSAIETV